MSKSNSLYDAVSHTLYMFDEVAQKWKAGEFRYLDDDFLVWPKNVHPLDWDRFKLRVNQFMTNYQQRTGYALTWKYDFNDNDKTVYLVLTLGEKSETISTGWIASQYNTTILPEGPTGAITVEVDARVRALLGQ